SWLLVTIIQLLMAFRAPYTKHTATELLLILAQEDRPPKPVAQRVVAVVRQDVQLLFAYWCAWLSVGLLVASILVAGLASDT
ncbi:MAG: hypothetical protein ACRCUX_15060, partial [Beijerinckiaceae bacterium]